MKSGLLFYLRYILFFLGIQILFNIVFLIVYHELAKEAGFQAQVLSLVHGLKLDISLTGYIMMLPTLLMIVFSILRKEIIRKITGIYTFLILAMLVPAYIANLVIYGYWNFPIDKSIFAYLSTPADMAASVSPLLLILLLGVIALVIYGLHFQIYRKWVSAPLSVPGKRSWPAAGLFLLIFPALILPIRGGLGTSPILVGSVYFHENTFINHAAVNPVWNLFYTMVEGDKLSQSIDFYTDEEVSEIMDELYEPGAPPIKVLNTDTPNIIIVLLESFGQPVITRLGGYGEAAPAINRLISEGIFFDHFYSTGSMTDRALGGVLGGYPGVPGTCILYYEGKAQQIPRLNTILKSEGYSSAFLYGGDIDFGHFRSFIVMGGFDEIIDDKYFPHSIPRSSWGVPDHYLFELLAGKADKASSPFFHVMLTLSSHTPFDVPMEPVFPGSDHLSKFYNSVYYTDQALGKFIETAKTRDWWKETLIILMADHGCRVGNTTAHAKERFNIPMLWLGGALSVRDTVISKIGSQTDVPATLLKQLNLPGDDFKFSNDLLSANTKSFTYYTYNNGIGFLTDTSYSVYSLVTKDFLVKQNSGNAGTVDAGLAYLQFLFDDFNSK